MKSQSGARAEVRDIVGVTTPPAKPRVKKKLSTKALKQKKRDVMAGNREKLTDEAKGRAVDTRVKNWKEKVAGQGKRDRFRDIIHMEAKENVFTTN